MIPPSEQLMRELARDLFKDSYYEFFKAAYKVLLPDEQYIDNWHIKYLCDTLQREAIRVKEGKEREKDLIINVPFRTAKSLITTVIFPVWVWSCVKASMKFICVSYSSTLALEHATMSRNLLNSEWYKSLYGENKAYLKEDANTKGFFVNYAGGFRKSVGMGGQITGSGADIIILDDPQDPKKAASEVERRNTAFYYDNTLYSRLNQPSVGLRIVVQQRLHENDLTGHLLLTSPENYNHIKIPGEITDKTKPNPQTLSEYYQNNLFWPTRFTKKILGDFRKRLGSYGYAGQIQQEPAPEEGGLFKESWFDIISTFDIVRDQTKEPIHFFIDSSDFQAGNDSEGGDYTAVLACFKKDNYLIITNVARVRKEFYELCNWLSKWVVANQYSSYSKIYIEPKSSGRSIVSQLRNVTKLNVIELPSPKDSKIVRASSIQPTIEARRVKLLEGAWNRDFLEEVKFFPNVEHDDRTDVLIYAVDTLLIQDSGFDFTFI